MKRHKIIFIDRDGVINKDPGGWTEHSYVTRWDDFHFLPGAREAIARLSKAGFEIVVISNQAGVSKGFFTSDTLNDITGNMLKSIKASGGVIKRIYYCIHQNSDNCDCRKPKTGLFKKAEEDLGLKAAGAYFIGDGRIDVEAGKAAGMKTILVLSGKTAYDAIGQWPVKPDIICGDLADAVDHILTQQKREG